jgi:RHS repeat-associated protein
MQIPAETLSQSHWLCFIGKERDSETGFSYFGARYYDSDLMTGWLSVDPMADDFLYISPYNYCEWNPVKLKDPNGEFPWIIVGGMLLDYGFQVYENYQEGKSGWQAFSDVNLLSIALSAIDLGKIKTATTIGKYMKFGGEFAMEATSNAFNINPYNGLSMDTDVGAVVIETVVAQTGSNIGKVANSYTNSITTKAVKEANKEVNRVQSRVNHAQQKNLNSPSQKNSLRLDKAKSEQQQVRNKQVLANMANSAVKSMGSSAPLILKYIAKNGVPDDKNGNQQ